MQGSAPLGILMLDTTFERPPGDVGHPASWTMPVVYSRIAGATARRIVDGDDADLLDAFIAAGEDLARDGAVGLITSCGFLAARQRDLTERLSLPIATSSLLMLPVIARTLPRGGRVGVVTYDAKSLTPAHFEMVGADPTTPVVGLPDNGAFRALIEGGAAYGAEALGQEIERAVADLIATHGNIAAIVFECTNLPPFARRIRDRFRLPVHDVITMGHWFYAGLVGADFA
jgi:hypothetical protein